MKTLNISKTALLHLITRQNTAFLATVENEAVAGATYDCQVFQDNQATLFTIPVTPTGNNLTLSLPIIAAPSGVFRYTLSRTTNANTKRILEGAFIILP